MSYRPLNIASLARFSACWAAPLSKEDRKVVDEHNQSTNQGTADKLAAVHDKLLELIEAQEAEIMDIDARINSLASKCST